MTLDQFIETSKTRLDQSLTTYLVKPHYPSTFLQQASTYSVLNGGKRIRPLLVYLAGKALGATWENLDAPATAIECIHVYSLIHDDLPAMDNSDLRRGKPSCHKAFDEATAILAGDALQTLAFEIIAKHPCDLNPEQRLKMIAQLAEASGIEGMAAGQAIDLAGTDSIETLNQMYHLKTGALLAASVKLGSTAAQCPENPLNQFAYSIGLAFQIQDDLLDITGADTGKPQGIDLTNNKRTYPALIGVEKSQQKVTELFTDALDSLRFLGEDGKLLQEFAHTLMQRQK